MEELIIKAQPRDTKLTGKNLRKQGIVPAVIYNHGKTDQLQITEEEIKTIFSHGVSESQLYDVEWGDKKERAFIKDYQVHPLTSKVVHVDFYRITYGEKVKTNIPVHLTGKSLGEKEGGILEIFLHDIELEILPRDLVKQIDVDISHLKIDDVLHVNDLTLPESAKVLVEGNPVVCSVSIPRAKAATTETAETEEGEAAPAEAKE